MKSFEEVGKILFNDRYWEGGNGGNYKAPYSNKTPKPYERCKNSKFLCGAIPEHVVMQDFDNVEAFECRLRIARALGESCVAIKSSGRGGHFYWFNRDRKIPKQSNGGKTLLTLEPVDYKPGIRVTGKGDVKKTIAAGCVSTSDGGLREIVYENIKEDGTLSEIPFYDLPMQSGVNHKFLGLKSGDGRNEGLLTFMLPMISAGYTYEQYMTVAKIINEYVFAEPLDNGEFETVTREEAWIAKAEENKANRFTDKSGRFRHNDFAEWLIEEYHIRGINGIVHTYRNGEYVPGNSAIEVAIQKEAPTLKRAAKAEVLDYIRVNAMSNTVDYSAPNLILFKNGVLDLNSGELLEHSPDYVIPNMIPWNYNPLAKSEMLDRFLNDISCSDTQIRALIEEMAGYCMYRSARLKTAFILTGMKDNGKSTLITLLKTTLGNKNYSTVDMQDLGDRFRTANLYGKLANVSAEISEKYKDDMETFKSIVSGDGITIEFKGKDPIADYTSFATCIFAANEKPRLKDPTGAVMRRLKIIPLNAQFTDERGNVDYGMSENLKKPEHVEAFIVLAVEGLKRALSNGFTRSATGEAEKAEYERENNPILAFIDEMGGIEAFENEPTQTMYEKYLGFCARNNFKEVSGLSFPKKINAALGTKTKDIRQADGTKRKCFYVE